MEFQYFSPSYRKDIDAYLESMSSEEKQQYYACGDKAIAIRETEGFSPVDYLDLIKKIGVYLGSTSGKSFTSTYQKLQITDSVLFYSFQLPGGGNLNVFVAPEGKLVIDTGYAVYHSDCETMLKHLGLGGYEDVQAVVCTHADADHCGASGYFGVPPIMHPVSKQILISGTRGYGSKRNNDVLEAFYTTTINTMSHMCIPEDIRVFRTNPIGYRGLFPIIDSISFAGLEFEVWESLGGHIAGQILLYEPKKGLLFTSDAFINFATLSKERADYCSVADSMIGSVNVDSESARAERRELLRLIAEFDSQLKSQGKHLTICCGHGAVSIVHGSSLLPASDGMEYLASREQ